MKSVLKSPPQPIRLRVQAIGRVVALPAPSLTMEATAPALRPGIGLRPYVRQRSGLTPWNTGGVKPRVAGASHSLRSHGRRPMAHSDGLAGVATEAVGPSVAAWARTSCPRGEFFRVRGNMGGSAREGPSLQREDRDVRAPAAHGWPCFVAGERGPDQDSDSLPRAGSASAPAPATHPARVEGHRRSAPMTVIGARVQIHSRVVPHQLC